MISGSLIGFVWVGWETALGQNMDSIVAYNLTEGEFSSIFESRPLSNCQPYPARLARPGTRASM
jgi:hypothetical protein